MFLLNIVKLQKGYCNSITRTAATAVVFNGNHQIAHTCNFIRSLYCFRTRMCCL